MNKTAKGLITFSLVTANMLCVGGKYDLFTTAAYASSDDADEISELDIEDSDGDALDLYSDSDYEDEIDDDLEEGETYYAESTTNKITIDTSDVDEDCVRIFANNSEYELGDKIKLKSGTNTIKIRVYEDEYDEDENYSSSDYNQYTIKVEYDNVEDSNGELSQLDLEDSDGDSIDLYSDSDYDEEVDDDLEEGETYYAESNTNKITLGTDDVDDDYIRILYNSKVYELGDSIKLSSGTNTLKVRVYDSEYDEDENYSSSDYSQYTLKINYGSDSDNSTSDVGLSSISLSSGSLTFNKNTSSYNINVNSDLNSISVEAIPEDSDYTVKINDSTVSESDYYSKKVTLTDSVTPVIIKVTNDENESKSYTVNITKTKKEDTLAMTNPYTQNNNTPSYVTVSQSHNTGWVNVNNIWNYYYSDGSKATGWILTGGNWYYLNSTGQMLTGWFLDSDGKWYYLYESGAMAANTTIDGYKIGPSGAWMQ